MIFICNFEIYSKNCDKFDGEFKEGYKNGYGTMKYQDGSKYKGMWENNCKHGKGTLYKPDGRNG